MSKARVWDVLSDPGSCSEAASAGQRLLDTLDDASDAVSTVVAEVSEIVPDVAREAFRATDHMMRASELIEPTVGRLRELGR